MTENDFRPDWVSAPGDTISDILEERNISLANFAEKMGHTRDYMDNLVRGHVMITIEIARKLEKVLGASAAFWMIRESQFREDVARVETGVRGTADTEWLRELPLKDMIKFGWLKAAPRPTDQVKACLRFFDTPDVSAWRKT
jgi:addiction module HigA family antidote